jgi:hypothetical protein
MTHRHRLLAPTLLFDLSLTSSRRLGRLFSQSEAPFGTACNQSRFRLLHSDYPLYFTSFESPRLKLNKPAAQDRYFLFVPNVSTVARQTVLDGGFQHSPCQPLALYSFFLFLHSRLLTRMVEIRCCPVTRATPVRGYCGFAPNCCGCMNLSVALCSSGCLVFQLEVAVFHADSRPIWQRKAQAAHRQFRSGFRPVHGHYQRSKHVTPHRNF